MLACPGLDAVHADGGNLMLSAALLTGTLGLGGFQAAGYGSNHQDLSPKYSGILFGLTNASASSAGALAVFATGTAPRHIIIILTGLPAIARYLLGVS